MITLVFFQNFGNAAGGRSPGSRHGQHRRTPETCRRGVLRDLERIRWADELRTVLYELEELLPGSPADFKFRAREHLAVFRENGFGDIQPGRFRDRKHEDGTLESARFQSITSLSGIIRAWVFRTRSLDDLVNLAPS
jgi:hypothetical protein